ncbi:MAG: DNA alkylation repair protein [Acidobacteria bacterium]|nr:DNA alkylation repair protein [Acidobacteriota bacterium]
MCAVKVKVPPTATAILKRLAELGSATARAKMAHFGVFPKKAYGISTPVLRRLGREIGRNHDLSLKLWASGIHEAQGLATFIEEPAKVTAAQMERWARDFDSWDIVDAACYQCFDASPHAYAKVVAWSKRKEEFVKRGAFSLMAGLAVHDKAAADSRFLRFLPLIERASDDERNFVRKAVNWALRQIGKRNLRLNRAAIACGLRIRKCGTRAARWIAADALRELQSAAVQKRLRAKIKH